MVRSLLPGLFGAVTMGVYFAVRVPSGLCVATSCVILFVFRLWEYLYEGHSFLFLGILQSMFTFTPQRFLFHAAP